MPAVGCRLDCNARKNPGRPVRRSAPMSAKDSRIGRGFHDITGRGFHGSHESPGIVEIRVIRVP